MNPYRALFLSSMRDHRNVLMVWLMLLVAAPVIAAIGGLIGSGGARQALAALDGWVLTPSRIQSWYILMPLLFFWGGQAVFRNERRSRADVWMRTVPVSDGTAIGIRLGAGAVAVFAAAALHYATLIVLEWILIPAGEPLGIVAVAGRYTLFLAGVLMPFYFIGATVRLVLPRSSSGRVLLLMPVLWIVGVFALVMWAAVVAQGDAAAVERAVTWLAPDRSQQAAYIVAHLAVAAAFAALAWWRASRVEIVV